MASLIFFSIVHSFVKNSIFFINKKNGNNYVDKESSQKKRL